MSAPTPDIEAARTPFADWAAVYRQRGYWPRPITPGSKACHVREWQKPDPDFLEATLASWLTSHADFGIGLLMGTEDARRTRHRPRRICARRTGIARPYAQRSRRQEGCGLLRSRRRHPQQSRVQGSGRRGQESRQGCRVPIRQEALRHPANDPSRHRPSLPLDREASARGRL